MSNSCIPQHKLKDYPDKCLASIDRCVSNINEGIQKMARNCQDSPDTEARQGKALQHTVATENNNYTAEPIAFPLSGAVGCSNAIFN